MLLQAHGLEKINVYEGKERKSESVLEDIVIDRLLCDITQLGYKCEIEKEKNIIYTTEAIRFRADFVIKTELLKKYGIKEWAFDVYVGPHRPVMQKLSWFFGCCYVNSLRDNGKYIHEYVKNKEYMIVGTERRHGFSQNDVDRQWHQIVGKIRKKQVGAISSTLGVLYYKHMPMHLSRIVL